MPGWSPIERAIETERGQAPRGLSAPKYELEHTSAAIHGADQERAPALTRIDNDGRADIHSSVVHVVRNAGIQRTLESRQLRLSLTDQVFVASISATIAAFC